ncbi:MAG TPA: leucine--tRNA ligase [Candidatus Saccharimonadales bacterium]|jgi:leucyl-tRNA synthetase|nr:leucine--tRNA ligase [Candidatus Saccharimonadales bacterium]
MKRYDPSTIEPKWQKTWADTKAYEVTEDSTKPKAYVAGMFPYPSGAGLHVGHVRNYAIVDVIARFHRQRGYNVMNPIGWDTFGLPAENYAIKTGTPPAVSTLENIKNFKNQYQRIGMSIDWSRELNTTDPEYYKWTQWIFTQLFERKLAYQAERMQWWCPHDKTVLANEQVEGGKCWRCGNVVIKKSMKQWFFKITEYADELLDNIDDLDWPEGIKAQQRNWIGKSTGAEVDFAIDAHEQKVTVFTTRPDTLYGATFLVLAPEHELVQTITSDAQKQAIENYIAEANKKSEIERQDTNREKTGVATGAYAINPVNNAKIPIWIADYVLTGYGTGAIMAVPAHDERDYEFATHFDLPIIEVYDRADAEKAFGGEGIVKNSDDYNGLHTEEMREKIVADLITKNAGHEKTNYRMRDWLISRQRYWGAPIPIIHCPDHGAVAVPESDLPVILPEVENYEPDGSGLGVLARSTDWVNTTCPTCGGPAKRETDTMDGYACSSWYYLRYADAHNDERAWDPAKANYWMPIDYYCGGDHAVSHLLYSRFWTKVFADMGLVNVREPVKKLVYNGYINAADGTKMSKSKGNVVDPLELVDAGYGADALRVYELFIAPYDLDAAWDPNGIAGSYRFLNRVWNLVQESFESDKSSEAPLSAVHKTIKKVTDDLVRLSFNTAIAAQMELVNELYKAKAGGMKSDSWQFALSSLVQMVAPFAPHIAEELWRQLGHTDSIHVSQWPIWDDAYLVENTVTIAIQVNGKVRGEIKIAKDTEQALVETAAKNEENIAAHLNNKQIQRVIYVPNRLLNIVL